MNSIYIDFIFVNEEEEKNTLIDLISYEQKKVCWFSMRKKKQKRKVEINHDDTWD